ncbi:DUF2971 domain-containing protein [Rhodococcus sp. MALMAid1271]|uniref:DUF2971 domain-containing protein n=1 Tax=Rhodococcus sp. MALMAid1271 TaxID=3411744 RepID=UPI003BA0D273
MTAENIHTASDDLLFHYTDPAGFVGIIQSSKLWATNAAFLNDTQEMTFGANLIAAEISLAASRLRHPSRSLASTDAELQKTQAWTQVLSYLQASYSPSRVSYGPYVVCFSKNGNDLGQWRGYANAGYAIGFEASTVVDSSGLPPTMPSEIKPVHYGADARAIAVNCADRIFEFLDRLPDDRELDDGELAQALEVADKWIPQLKHEAFTAEAERRLWVPEIRDVKFRPSPLGLIPYKEVPINLDAIRKVVVGPGPNQKLRTNALQILLEQKFPCSEIEVETSEIPFRG